MAFDPASRFSFTAQPAMQPAKDLITGETVGPFVDTGRDIQFAETGRVYLSINTVQEMADGLGLFEPFKERIKNIEADGYQRGLLDGVKENLGGDIRLLVDRLGGLVDGLLAEPVLPAQGTSAPDSSDEPAVLSADGAPSEAVGVAKPAQRRPRGQGNGARSQRRPAGISGDSGDGTNPFRI